MIRIIDGIAQYARAIAITLVGAAAVAGCAGIGDLPSDPVVVANGHRANFVYCDSLTITSDSFPLPTSTMIVAPNTNFDVVYTITNNDSSICNNVANPYIVSGAITLNGDGGAGDFSIPGIGGDENVITWTAHYHTGSTTGYQVVNLNAAGFIFQHKYGGARINVESP